MLNAIITGATKGIGKAIAFKLAAQGYNLAICARTEADLLEVKKELEQYQISVLAIRVDLRIKQEIFNFCNQVAEVFGTADILVNNAGIFEPGGMIDETDEVFEHQNMVNVNSVYYISKYFGKIMRSQSKGHIFNICSVASKKVVENAGSYAVTKTAMLSLNYVLRKELSPYNIKVTAILPGSTLTASWEGTEISPEKFVQPKDIAEMLYAILNLSNGANVDEIVLTPLNF